MKKKKKIVKTNKNNVFVYDRYSYRYDKKLNCKFPVEGFFFHVTLHAFVSAVFEFDVILFSTPCYSRTVIFFSRLCSN